MTITVITFVILIIIYAGSGEVKTNDCPVYKGEKGWPLSEREKELIKRKDREYSMRMRNREIK